MKQFNVYEKEAIAVNQIYNRLLKSKATISFYELIEPVNAYMASVMKKEKNDGIEIHHNAVAGKPSDVAYFISHIEQYLNKNGYSNTEYPDWYSSLASGIFHEKWGYGCIANFFDLKESSSAKIIGDRIYYLIDGVEVLQPQKISEQSWTQLKANVLLNDTTQTVNKRDNVVEVNLNTGERVTIFSNKMTKPGQESMIIRKYIVNDMTWEEQARRNTIPKKSIPFFKSFARVGYNVLFAGQVRSGKTTFLTTWQTYENPEAEGILLEKTPEIPINELMPSAPIIQLLLPKDNENFDDIIAAILRGDPDYVIMAEARVGAEFAMMVDVASKGTRRCKTTLHTSDVKTCIYDIADAITRYRGEANNDSMILKVAGTFHYIIELTQTYGNKAVKKLKSITEVHVDRYTGRVLSIPICLYDSEKDEWSFNYFIGEDKRQIAKEEDLKAFQQFDKELKKLAKEYPMKDKKVFVTYSRGKEGNTWIDYQQ